MPRRAALPGELDGTSFGLQVAANLGVSRRRLQRSDVGHPFHGVYTVGVDTTDLVERCRAIAPRLDPREHFSHVTAARLWGIPLPRAYDPSEAIHVTAIGVDDRTRPAGLVGWRVEQHPPEVRRLGPLSVIAPADVWATLGMRGAVIPRAHLFPEWLVAAGDYLVSGERIPGGRLPALASLADLRAAALRRAGKRGSRVLHEAIPLIRQPVDSPRETLLRLALIAHGLPEPVVQPSILTRAGMRHPDLGYVDERVLLEYQGDEHRTSRARWLRDLTRVQEFEDAGYRVILVGDDDLRPGAVVALCARVRRALA